MCAGFFTTHGSNSIEEVQELAPLSDPSLTQHFLDIWPDFIEWLEKIEIPFGSFDREVATAGGGRPGTGTYKVYQFGTQPSPAGNEEFSRHLEDYLSQIGVEVILKTGAQHLILNETGAVIGVEAVDVSGKQLKVKAKNVILACGGFCNNKEMLTRYVSCYGDLISNTGSPYSAGAGMLMAQEAGAILSRSQGSFYGHCMPYRVEVTQDRKEWDEGIVDLDWNAKQQSCIGLAGAIGGQYGVVVNLGGKRFFDETQDDLLLNQEIALQKYARAYEIIDSSIRAAHVSSPLASKDFAGDRIDYIKNSGGQVFEADTLDGLADLLAKEGVPKGTLIRTINEYNATIDAGDINLLDIPKADSSKIEKIVDPPFIAVAVVPGVSFTYGGVQTDTDGRILDKNYHPIPGLWATLGVAGGLQYGYYIGILATIMPFARHTGTKVGESLSAL
jgi:succinate dehydrogenase/fumarate reductase flavoprotein subunit